MYPVGTFGHEANGRRLRVFEAYIEARRAAQNGLLSAEEAMSTSDFPTYMGSFLRHSFLARYEELSGSWSAYTADLSVDDFEEYTSSRFGRFADIPEKPLNGPYTELAIAEGEGPSYRLSEWGAAFSLTRQIILSDRLNKLADLPTMFAEAMARTVSKKAVSVLEANGDTYDSNALFSVAHSNIGSTALTANAAGADTLIAADQALDSQTDHEGYKIVAPTGRTLIIPVEYKYIVQALRENETLINASNLYVPNQARTIVDTVITERYLTDANNWYLSADLKGRGAFMGHVTLNGNSTPFLGVRDPEVRGVLGGDDPYSFDFDEIGYKIRHDFSFKLLEWQFIYGAIVA